MHGAAVQPRNAAQGEEEAGARPSPRGTRTSSSCLICSSESGILLEGQVRPYLLISKPLLLIPGKSCGQSSRRRGRITLLRTTLATSDESPLVFRTLRKLFRIDPANYMLSICGNDALRELSFPGKSGSFFYLTQDDKYMIKTMKKSEVKVLLRMLPVYYEHVRAFENTLVTKFFGLHCVKLTGATQRKVRFVIMGNLFCSEYPFQRCFDLKGSSLGRITDKPAADINENTTLKDLDLNFIFRLQKCWIQEMHWQVDQDCEFLEQERIMDYRLLVGLHFRDSCTTEIGDGGSLGNKTFMGSPDSDIDTSPCLSRADTGMLVNDPNDRWPTSRLGINMPARAEQTVRKYDSSGEPQLIGGPSGYFCDVVLYFGIIDILQDYDISKKLEHAYKSIQHDPTSMSAVDPKQYSRRFRDFIVRAFVEDTSSSSF